MESREKHKINGGGPVGLTHGKALKLSKIMWPLIERRAKAIDKKYPGFRNKKLEAPAKETIKELEEMVVY